MKTQLSEKTIPQPSNTLKKVYETLFPSWLAFLKDKWNLSIHSPVWLFDLSTWKEVLTKRYDFSWISSNWRHWYLIGKDKNNYKKINEFLIVREDGSIIDFFDWFDVAHNLGSNEIDFLWMAWDIAYILRHNFDKTWKKIEWTSIYSKNMVTNTINENYFKWQNLMLTSDFRFSSYDWTVFVAIDQNSWGEILLDHALTPIILPRQYPGYMWQNSREFTPVKWADTLYPTLWEKTILLESTNPTTNLQERFLYEYTGGRCLIWPYENLNWVHEGKAVVCTDYKTLVVDKWNKVLFEVDWVDNWNCYFIDGYVLINWDLYNEHWEKRTFPYIKNNNWPEYLWIVDWLFHFVLRNSEQQRVNVFTDLNWNPVSENIASLTDAKKNIRAYKIKDNFVKVYKGATMNSEDTIKIFPDSSLLWNVENLWNGLFEVETTWTITTPIKSDKGTLIEVKKEVLKKKYYSGTNKSLEFKSIEELEKKAKIVNETKDFLEIWWKKFKKSLTKGFKIG